MLKLSAVFIGIVASANMSWSATSPNNRLTPGKVCTSSDSDFSGYDYPEQIARCSRNIGTQEKQQVAQAYGGIPQSSWPNYEFDHLIPLCAGGSNSTSGFYG